MWQQTVIIPLATSEPISLLSECHTWNDGEVNMGIVSKECPEGFLNAKCSTGVHGVLTFIYMKRKVIADYRRK